jgi:hypothetical protein
MLHNPFCRLAIPFRWNGPFLPLPGHETCETRLSGLSGLFGLFGLSGWSGLSGSFGWTRLPRGRCPRQAEASRFSASEVFTTQVPSGNR